jgi:hypothetical protein
LGGPGVTSPLAASIPFGIRGYLPSRTERPAARKGFDGEAGRSEIAAVEKTHASDRHPAATARRRVTVFTANSRSVPPAKINFSAMNPSDFGGNLSRTWIDD